MSKVSQYVPAIRGMESIVLNAYEWDEFRYGYRSDLLYLGSNKLSILLWDNYDKICELYKPRLVNGGDVEVIADEVMQDSSNKDRKMINLLRYIHRNRAIRTDEPYDKVWSDINKTYRKFVIMVLQCVSLERTVGTDSKDSFKEV